MAPDAARCASLSLTVLKYFMEQITTLILGGGQGKRLFPLTGYRSKPAVPMGGKYRLVDIPISNSINSGLNRIFVLTQFNSTSLHRHIHRTYPYSLFNEISIELLAAEQTLATADWFQGTADAVRKHFSHYPMKTTSDFLILSGDHLYRMDYRDIIKFHREKNADVTVATIPVPKRDVSGFGIMQIAPDAKITSFLEKPSRQVKIDSFVIPSNIRKIFNVKGKNDLYLASMGIYVFKTEVLKDVLAGNETDFGKEVIPKAINRHKVYGYVFNDYWRDIGTISSFYEANIELTKPNPPFQFLSSQGRIYTRARFLPPSRIFSAEMTNALIAEGCNLDGVHVEDSIIGLRSNILKGSLIRKSVVMGSDSYELEKPKSVPPLGIGKNCHIQDAILDKNVRIGNRVSITNRARVREKDGENYYIRDGIVIVPKNAIIPDGTTI